MRATVGDAPSVRTPVPRLRVLVVVESLARVPRMELLHELLDKAGVPRAVTNVVAVVQQREGPVRARQIREAAAGVAEAVGDRTAVLLVGNTPLEAVTGQKGIKNRRGRPWVDDRGNVFLPILPPGVTLYDERTVPMMEADCRLFGEIVRRGEVPREEGLDWSVVDSPEQFEAMLADLRGTVSFDIETACWRDGELVPTTNPWVGHVEDGQWVLDSRVVSVGFGTATRQWCLPIHHPEARTEQWLELSLAQIFARVDRRLRDCVLVAHNGKFDSVWLRVHFGVDWRPDFDTMIAHWMLDENQRQGLKILAQVHLGAPNYDADLDVKAGTGPLSQHCLYLAHDVYYTRVLKQRFAKMLERDPGVARAFYDIMMPVSRLFCDVEYRGVLVDYDRFEEAEVHLRGKISAAEKALHKACAEEVPGYEPGAINWRSTKQLANLFFEVLGLSPLDKTKSGKSWATSESVLKRLDHPCARALMDFREADQSLKMFIDGWRPFLVLHEDGWRLHPSFKLTGTVTGRASCEHPNLQQVPRDELIRSLIGAPLGWQLLDMDLSQIEMRISAELSGDRVLLGIFQRDEDVHWMTALKEITRGAGMADEILHTAEEFCRRYPQTPWLAECGWRSESTVLGVDRRTGRLSLGQTAMTYSIASQIVYRMGPDVAAAISPTWKELRKKAKAINFGYLFGMWWKKMIVYARDNYGVHLTERQARESRDSFFSTYPALAPWHERQRRYARRHGYVRSLSGARRNLPKAMSPDDSPERGEAFRQAVNSPVQRFACELNYMVLLQLVDEFGLDVIQPVGTVHDAVLAEVRDEWVERVYTRAEEIMRGPALLQRLGIRLNVPIKGEAKIGPWSRGVHLDKWKKARVKCPT